MRNPPPEVIKSWPKPNYVNPEYAGPELAIIGVTFTTLSVIVMSLRMYVRLHLRKAASWDDWLMVAAMPFLMGISASAIVSTKYGWGFHIWDFKFSEFRQSRITSYICQVLFIPLMTLVKLSILASYLRFFTEKIYIRLAWIQVGLVLAWFVAFMVLMLIACIPLSNYWNSFLQKGCMEEEYRLLPGIYSNAVMDVMILVTPCPALWKLHLPVRDRIVLIGMMCLGFISCVAGCVKSWYMYRTLVGTYDVTWEGYNVWVWTDLEINLAVICTSIPVLRPFAQKYFPKLGFKSSNAGSRYGNRWGSSSNPSNGLGSGGIYKHQTIHQFVRSRQTEDEDDGGSTIALSPAEFPTAKTYPTSSGSYDSRSNDVRNPSRSEFRNDPTYNDYQKDRYNNYV
ncbi:hypothetical protein TMEN_2543 [Trichophyton mentagrophytes]|uniref:Alpha-galactosidase B n=2 Tax=Trichophyton interdigitale TaxID=101480 RepID=A0A9P4YL70_9EURO|nr:putative alpha-galactosidase B [Trichophyton interdigitale]KAG5207145.1 putative alpha-galactosidase B [Trichophyton interdigitale]KAG8207641.1 putative alpha-galactosidase B [Trichophyton interdigitale]KDB22631.1 hypothetical protein H109_05463 [Trichophyton interdigitale MR816]GBF60139.1 hypothetical protein TMEN_2543 [Trichophyton mentagrophytes]